MRISRQTISRLINVRGRRVLLVVASFTVVGVAAIAFSGAQQLQQSPTDPVTSGAAVVPNDPYFSDQPMLKIANIDQLWQRTTGRADSTIAIIGTGINASHPELAGKVVDSYDFINKNTDATPDSVGTGTAQAGIIAANSNDGIGMTGICWACKIMPLDVHKESDDTASAANTLAAFNYAVDKGADVIYVGFTYKLETAAQTQAIKQAHAKGIIVVSFVSSNGTDTASEVSYPATVVPEVISVTGTNDDDSLRTGANFGSKVDIAAPSSKVLTLGHTATGQSYVTWSSNGASAAVIAGIAALLRSAYPQATATEIGLAITTTGDTCCGGKINGGRVNALKAADYLEKLYPTQQPAKKGDINNDGKVNLQDLSMLLSRWNTADAAADLNKDGKVTLTDLSVLLSNWTG